MKDIFLKLVAKGYEIHNKRVLGNPAYTSEETKLKDAIQEIALVCEWLRINHGIWIAINPKREKINGINEMWYDAEVWKLESNEIKGYGWSELAKTFDTPQEAYSAAFDYIRLNNLI